MVGISADKREENNLDVDGQRIVVEPVSKLKIIFPPDLNPSDFLRKSCRFYGCALDDFKKLEKFISDHFNTPFEILNSNTYIPNDDDLKECHLIAFLSINDEHAGARLEKYASFGIPVIFIKYTPEMECEVINVKNMEGECFQNRSNCGGQFQNHCDKRFFESLNPREPKGHKDRKVNLTIPIIEQTFNIEDIPIFSMSFLIDFIVWYGNYGKNLRDRRDSYIIKAKQEYDATLDATIKDALRKEK